MPQMHDRIRRVLRHDPEWSLPGREVGHQLSDARVEVVEERVLRRTHQQVVVGEECQSLHVVHLADAVQLRALVIVDMGPLFLERNKYSNRPTLMMRRKESD